ncbi:hypothetical protein P12x_002243 [Tundrisphaera lichenicola]|uniref:hypothetical protein n=1 Tax=Tundrisphaera lichenicola TaxID=2029860 RepID=UPI003EB78D39
MMRFTVVWREIALGSLAELWSTSPNRRSVNEAVEAIDRLLRDDPDRQGDDFYGDRVLVISSIAFTFSVHEEDRTVEIIDLFSKE